jgi:hypothetical protein
MTSSARTRPGVFKRLRPKYRLGVRRLTNLALLLVLAGVGHGCGGEEAAAPAPLADPAQALVRVPERLREVGTFEFEASFVETKKATPGEHTEYMTLEGALDLAAGEGRTVVDMTWFGEEIEKLRPSGDTSSDPAFEALFGAPVEVRWNAREAYVRAGDYRHRGPRAQLRTGTLGTTAEELANLIGLLPRAENVRTAGAADVDGEPTTHVLFTVTARRAGAAGVPAELYGAFTQALHGPDLQLEAWLDADGLPRRLAYSVSKGDIRVKGKLVIPAKRVRVMYTLSRFGDDVDTAPPD